LAVYSDARHHYLALLRKGDHGQEIILRRVVDDMICETAQPWSGHGPVRIQVLATPLSYLFVAEGSGFRAEIGQGSARLLSAEACEWFVGANFVLCAFGSRGGCATFTEVALG
jgi:hypothetical protein